MARIDNLTNFLTDVATSIKAKTGDSSLIPASQFDTKIAGIQTGKLTNEEYAKANDNLDEILYQSENVLPDTYQEVEYLEASGTQYIDTGYAFTNPKMKIKIKYRKKTYLTRNVFGVDLFGSLPRKLHGNVYNKALYLGNGSVVSDVTQNLDTDYVVEFSFDNNIATWIINDEEYVYNGANNWAGTSNEETDYLFATRGMDETATYLMIGRIYYAKYYNENDELVRNFIPCYRKSDDKPGMYDTVNNVFYTNQGTGEFVVGADVDVLNSKIESILTEKNIKISPENIKKDINILGITGTYSGDGKNFQANYNLYQKMNSTYSKTSLKLTVNKTGTYTVRWIAYRSSTSYDDFGTAIYINDILYGTKNTTWNTPYIRENSVEYTSTSFQINEVQNVPLNENDVIEIYGKNHSSYNIFLTALTIEEE